MARKITCGSSCFFGRKGCKDIRKCACSCGPLKAINPNLFDACVDQCNTGDFPSSPQDFKCNYVGGEVLFNYYGLIDCGFTIDQSASFQVFDQQVNAHKELDDGNTSKFIILGLGVLIIAGVLSLLIK